MTRFSYPEGCFHIEPTQAQPQIAHCHGFFVHNNMRGKGLAHVLKQTQMAVLLVLGYNYATCTVDSENEAQKKVLIKADWHCIDEFNNSKTGGITQLWGCEINRENKK